MRKIKLFGFITLIAVAVMIMTGCASSRVWYRQDGLVKITHFQTMKNEGERLVFISPVLASNHQASLLYIITNPEDIYNALDAIGDNVILSLRNLQTILKPFSPVEITSRNDLPNLGFTKDGIAGFSLPSFVDQFFYTYLLIKDNEKLSSNTPVEIQFGIMPLPPGSQDVYIAFSEKNGEMTVSTKTNVEEAYFLANGLYGIQLGNTPQIGFIPITFKERMELSSEQAKAKALAEGATFTVSSGYYTYQQETQYGRSARRVSSEMVGRRIVYDPSTASYVFRDGVEVGQQADFGEIYEYTVDVPVRQDLAFELYKGNTKVYSGTTPAKISGIEVGTEYTLRWVSPVDGNKTYRFKMGLNSLGYPGNGRYTIK